MQDYLKHLPQQWPVVEAMAKAIFKPTDALGGPTRHEVTLPPLSEPMVKDFCQWSGARESAYPNCIPGHLFPQWAFPLLAKNIETLPYPMQKVLNQGCEIRQKGVLPLGQPLQVVCELIEVKEESSRVRIHQRVSTGSVAQPDLLTCEIFGVVVTETKTSKKKKSSGEELPWNTVGGWTASAHEGLAFAMLTGDFNPIHWIGPYARHFGFDNTILHGFASLSRTYEVLRQYASVNLDYIPRINVRFTRPLVLPNKMNVLVQEDTVNKIKLVDEKGINCMVGDYSFELPSGSDS
jgi:acyl dehydratase